MSVRTSPKPKILMLIGTRPEAIKMAPLYLALKATNRFQLRLVSSGQHAEMLHEALAVFGLKPHLDLRLMEPGQSLTRLLGRSLTALDELLRSEQPDQVLVHGDTATCFAGALACFYSRIPYAHVEAGLRSYRLDSPFPEEFHRQVVCRAANVHFAPTQESAQNLRAEGIPQGKILVTGSTSVDSVSHVLGEAFGAKAERLVLVTAHRRENGVQGLEEILKSVKLLAKLYPDHRFVLPVHPNPNVRSAVETILPPPPNLELVDPLSYPDFVKLMAASSLIITDSGGIQEEAAFLGKRVLLTRETTERPEALDCGSAKLVGTNAFQILQEAQLLLNGPAHPLDHNPFGAGGASQRIAQYLVRQFAENCKVLEAA